MFAEERMASILDIVRVNEKVIVSDLTDKFSVSGATIRSDLREMERQGLLKRVHGGAISAKKSGIRQSFQERQLIQLEAKKQIAKKASSFIKEGDTLILDSGTTSLELAKKISRMAGLTVITNDLNIANILADERKIELIFLGGAFMKDTYCTYGRFVWEMLAELSADKTFLATSCFSPEKGCTTHGLYLTEIKRAMIQNSSEIIVLCDHTKIGKNALSQFATPKQIDILITDLINERLKNQITDLGINVIESV